MKDQLLSIERTVRITLLYLCGLGCFVYGCSLIYRPLGWIVGGLMVLAISMLMDREHAKDKS